MSHVTFILPNGERREIEASVGRTLLEVAWDNNLDVEGACGGVAACSTCHVIVDPAWAGRLASPDKEEDQMLDLAWGLSSTSRLGCQIALTDGLDGLVVSLPTETHSMLDV
jgi:2Fe-2S ferredoxin